MKTQICIITYPCTITSMICILEFIDPTIQYFIRGARDNSEFEWEIRYFQNKRFNITEIDPTIGDLLYAHEDVLFQRSCVEKFDVYMVQAGMQELHRMMISTDSTDSTDNKIHTLEY